MLKYLLIFLILAIGFIKMDSLSHATPCNLASCSSAPPLKSSASVEQIIENGQIFMEKRAEITQGLSSEEGKKAARKFILQGINELALHECNLFIKRLLVGQKGESWAKVIQLNAAVERIINLSAGNMSLLKETIDRLEGPLMEMRQETILFSLIRREFYSTAHVLIDAGVGSIHSSNGVYQLRPLHKAVEKGQPELAKILIERGADVNAEACQPAMIGEIIRLTPLSIALQSIVIDQELFHFLVQAGANVNAESERGKSVFYSLLERGLFDLADLVLESVDFDRVTFRDIERPTPIHLAVFHRRADWVEKFQRKGLDINALALCEGAWSPRKVTPLHIAVNQGNVSLVASMLELGADPNIKAENRFYGEKMGEALSDPEPLTAFQMAVSKNTIEVQKAIVEWAANHSVSLDGEVEIERGIFDKNNPEGKDSLKFRIKTAEVATHKVESISPPYSVYSRGGIEIIENIYQFISGESSLGGAEAICRPLLDRFRRICEEEAFDVYFVKEGDLGKSSGGYNSYTKDQIALVFQGDYFTLTPVLVHEIGHKVTHKHFNRRDCAPFSPSETLEETSFGKAMQNDLRHLEETRWENCHPSIKDLFENIKQIYPERELPAEIIVRIPQAAAKIALCSPSRTMEDIDTIFKESIPHLYK